MVSVNQGNYSNTDGQYGHYPTGAAGQSHGQGHLHGEGGGNDEREK